MTTPTEVYIVTHGDYSDYGILGVFLDRAIAEEFIAQNRGDIEVWLVDKLTLPVGHRKYAVTMAEDGSVDSVSVVDATNEQLDYNEYDDGLTTDGTRYHLGQPTHTGHRTFHVTTDMGEQGAIKVANERRVQLIALNQWPVKGSPKVF